MYKVITVGPDLDMPYLPYTYTFIPAKIYTSIGAFSWQEETRWAFLEMYILVVKMNFKGDGLISP